MPTRRTKLFWRTAFWSCGKISNVLKKCLRKRIKNRKQRSLYLSSVRSYLFNQTVQTRINQHKTFPLAGDIAMLKGTRSFFHVDSWDDQLQRRLQERDIVLSAPLGRGT